MKAEPIYFVIGWRLHSPMDPIGVASIEEAVETAKWGRDDNTFYATGVQNRDGELLLSEKELQDAVDRCHESAAMRAMDRRRGDGG